MITNRSRSHSTPTGMARIKKIDDSRCGRGRGETKPHIVQVPMETAEPALTIAPKANCGITTWLLIGMVSVLLFSVTKYLSRNNLKEEEFILAHSLRW